MAEHTPPTEMGIALQSLRAAESRVREVKRESMRLLRLGGFRVTECSDPERWAFYQEIAAETRGTA
jgi:hypothetical protein